MSSFRLPDEELSVRFAEIPDSSEPEQEAEIIKWPYLNDVERTYQELYRDFVRYALNSGGQILDPDIDPAPIPQSSAAPEPYPGPAW